MQAELEEVGNPKSTMLTWLHIDKEIKEGSVLTLESRPQKWRVKKFHTLQLAVLTAYATDEYEEYENHIR